MLNALTQSMPQAASAGIYVPAGVMTLENSPVTSGMRGTTGAIAIPGGMAGLNNVGATGLIEVAAQQADEGTQLDAAQRQRVQTAINMYKLGVAKITDAAEKKQAESIQSQIQSAFDNNKITVAELGKKGASVSLKGGAIVLNRNQFPSEGNPQGGWRHRMMTSLVHEGYHVSNANTPNSIDQELAALKSELTAYQALKAASTPAQVAVLENVEKNGYEKALKKTDEELRREIREQYKDLNLPEHSS